MTFHGRLAISFNEMCKAGLGTQHMFRNVRENQLPSGIDEILVDKKRKEVKKKDESYGSYWANSLVWVAYILLFWSFVFSYLEV